MELRYIKPLDGVRGLAAFMVLFYHFWSDINSKDLSFLILKKISVFGQTGVTLFFVLSGFLISRILLNTKLDPNYFKAFYARRSLRIFPLYFFFLCLFYLIMPHLIGGEVDTANSWYYWLFLQNVAMTFKWNNFGPIHYWSLAVEEHFYLILPLIIYFFNPNKVKIILLFIILIPILVRVLLLMNGLEVFWFTLTTMDALALGSLLALLEFDKILTEKNGNKFLWLLILTIIPTILMWFSVSGKGLIWVEVIKLSLLSLIYFSFVGYVISANQKNVLSKILLNRFLQFTGKISYGLYIYHPLCFLLVNKYFKFNSFVLQFIIVVSFSYLISFLSWTLFESKVLFFKKYFVYSKKASRILS